MRSLVLLILLLASSPAWSLKLICEDCRNPALYPMDFGNFVFNQVFGSNAWVPISEGGRIEVRNLNGQWAVVDLNYVLQTSGLTINLGFLSIGLIAPTGLIQIKVQTASGALMTYEVFVNSPDLIVGAGNTQTFSDADADVESAEQEPVSSPDKMGTGLDLSSTFGSSYSYISSQSLATSLNLSVGE